MVKFIILNRFWLSLHQSYFYTIFRFMKSKFLYLSTFVFLLVVYQANAQDFKSGLRLGVNAAQINGDGMGGFNKPGFVGGLFVRYDFTQRVSGQFEMLYSAKGSKRTYHQDYGWSPGIWHDLR